MKHRSTPFVITRLLCVICVWALGGSACSLLSAAELVSDGDLSIRLTTGPELLIDANEGCNGEPLATYVGYEICNLSAGTLREVEVNLGDFTQAHTGLAGGQQASQWVGDMAPGACRNLYWYIYYDCANGSGLVEMTLTVSDSSELSATHSEVLYNRSVITASAGGVIVSMNDSIGGYVGSLLVVDYLYSFGNMKKDGELYMQPAGNLDFEAGCFQLIGAEVTASDVNGVAVGDRDQLYYLLPSNTNGSYHEIAIRYYFMNKCENVATAARGYAAATSGNALKLSPNIGDAGIDFSLPEAVNPFEITKSVSSSQIMQGESADYTVTLTNTSPQHIMVDRIVDVLPPDFSFDTTLTGSDIHAGNASKFPLRGETDTLVWWGGTAAAVYPYTTFLLEPGASIHLNYRSTADLNAIAGERINYAQAISGAYETPFAAAWLCVGDPCTLSPGGNDVSAPPESPQTQMHPALYLYPSETHNHFHIRYNRVPAGRLRLRIINSLGRTVLSQTEAGNSFEVGGLPEGMYFITVSDGVVSVSRKFVVTAH